MHNFKSFIESAADVHHIEWPEKLIFRSSTPRHIFVRKQSFCCPVLKSRFPSLFVPYLRCCDLLERVEHQSHRLVFGDSVLPASASLLSRFAALAFQNKLTVDAFGLAIKTALCFVSWKQECGQRQSTFLAQGPSADCSLEVRQQGSLQRGAAGDPELCSNGGQPW